MVAIIRHRPDVEPLASVTPFDRYPRRSLRRLAAHTDLVTVPEGTVLAREGGLVHEMLVVVDGEVVASRCGATERRHGPGTRFGACELLTGAPHPDTLVAGTALEVLVINGPAYRGAAQTLPGLATAG
jgi:CRP-like cAMP-binding protein